MNRFSLVLITLLSACGSDGNNVTCGAGTSKSGNTCVANGVDAPPAVTCGTGTHLSGDTCVPDVPPTGAAPTITSITPDHAGLSGLAADAQSGVLFAIDGTGFADPNAGEVHVLFGDVEAAAVVVDDHTITGWIPANDKIVAPVTVKDDNGMASTAFAYDALIGGDGRDAGGKLYLIDPTNGLSLALGPIMGKDDANADVNMGVSGLAFDAAGTLYGATVGVPDPATLTYTRQLVTIDPSTGVATKMGVLTDGAPWQIGDIKFSGGTLYGYGYSYTADGYLLSSIDPATGATTAIGTTPVGGYGVGIAFDGAGALWLADNGVGPAVTLSSVDTGTGAITAGPTLDGTQQRATGVAPIDALAYQRGTLYGAVNTGTYSAGSTPGGAGTVLVSVDTTTGHVTEIGPLPDFIDALDAAPATLAIAKVRGATWTGPTRAIPRRVSCASTANGVPVTGGRVALARPTATTRVALDTAAHSPVVVTACGGGTLAISAAELASYSLVRNKRGQVKLVNAATGRTVMRAVTSISAR